MNAQQKSLASMHDLSAITQISLCQAPIVICTRHLRNVQLLQPKQTMPSLPLLISVECRLTWQPSHHMKKMFLLMNWAEPFIYTLVQEAFGLEDSNM